MISGTISERDHRDGYIRVAGEEPTPGKHDAIAWDGTAETEGITGYCCCGGWSAHVSMFGVTHAAATAKISLWWQAHVHEDVDRVL
jgi:hypothetical protein